MRDRLKQILVKLQSTEGTPEASLTASDFIWCYSDSSVKSDVGFGELDLVGCGFDQPSAVVGRQKGEVEISVPLKDYGVGNTPAVDPLWRGAGFTKVEQNGYYQYTFDPKSTEDLTVWCYSGNLNTDKSLIEKVGNVKLGWKLALDFMNDVIGKATFSGMGRYIAAPTVGTQPVASCDRIKVPGLRGVTAQVNGIAYKLLNLEIDGGQVVTDQVDATDSTGVGITYITDQKINFSAKVYRDVTNIPYTNMLAGTEGPISVEWGSGTKVQVYMGYAQIKEAATSTEGGIETYDIKGQCSRNDFKIRYLGGDSSSSSSSSS